MYVVVVGMGQVGRSLVGILERTGHDVVAIDHNQDNLDELEADYDVATLMAHGGSPETLLTAKIDQADLIITSTQNDELNLLAAMIGKQLGAKHAIARIHHTEYTGKTLGINRNMLDIDVVITPRIIVAHEIAKTARSHGALDVIGFVGNSVEMVLLQLPNKSKMLHKALANLHLPKETLVAAIVRDDELFVPGGADVMLPDDRIYLVGKAGEMDPVIDLFTGGKETSKIFIVGGGVIGSTLAKLMGECGIGVVLVDKDKDTVDKLSENLPKAEVLHADGTDTAFLKEEMVGNFDLFCAVTRNDEVNLMAGLIAKGEGAKRIISVVQRPEYQDIYHELGIHHVISPRVVAIEHIESFVQQTELQSLHIVEQGQAEVLEMTAKSGSRIVGTPIRRLNLPRGAILTAIVSEGAVTIPRGSDTVKDGDTVVILTTAATRPSIERLFRQRGK